MKFNTRILTSFRGLVVNLKLFWVLKYKYERALARARARVCVCVCHYKSRSDCQETLCIHGQCTFISKITLLYCPDCRNVNIRIVFIHHVTHLEFLYGITINAHLQHKLPSFSFLQTSCAPLCPAFPWTIKGVFPFLPLLGVQVYFVGCIYPANSKCWPIHIICEQDKFHAQFSWACKKFYNLWAWSVNVVERLFNCWISL